MVDVEQCINDFLSAEKASVYDKKYGWHDEEVNRTRENMIVLTFNNGDGVAVLDKEKFEKLSKTKQNKFLNYINKGK